MCFDRFSPIIALILTAFRHETDDEKTNNFGERGRFQFDKRHHYTAARQ